MCSHVFARGVFDHQYFEQNFAGVSAFSSPVHPMFGDQEVVACYHWDSSLRSGSVLFSGSAALYACFTPGPVGKVSCPVLFDLLCGRLPGLRGEPPGCTILLLLLKLDDFSLALRGALLTFMEGA